MGVPSRAKRYDEDRVLEKAQREADEESEEAPPVKSVYVAKLQPFLFIPDPVPEQQELQKAAERKVLQDKTCLQAIRDAKDAVTKALQDGLDQANEQLARGEAITRQAQFPLLNPVHFKDLEELAHHDFTIDVHSDVVDGALRRIVAQVLKLVWSHVTIENLQKVRSLERYNDALLARMETLDHHLSDRSKQLSSSRFAYFLEITHLRNQVYRKFLEGEEFEPIEAYFFDPTEYLEEDLRMMLNDKIKMSCRTYHRRVMELKRHCEDLELQLETALQRTGTKRNDSLNELLQVSCHKHGRKTTVHALQQFAEKEMLEWAEKLILKRERLMADAAKEELETLRGELQNKTHETQHTRECLKRAIDELKEEQKRLEEIEAQMALLRSEKKRMEDIAYGQKLDLGILHEEVHKAAADPTDSGDSQHPVDNATAEEMELMRKQMAKLKEQLEREQDKREEAEMQAKMMSDRQEALQRTIAQNMERRNQPPVPQVPMKPTQSAQQLPAKKEPSLASEDVSGKPTFNEDEHAEVLSGHAVGGSHGPETDDASSYGMGFNRSLGAAAMSGRGDLPEPSVAEESLLLKQEDASLGMHSLHGSFADIDGGSGLLGEGSSQADARGGGCGAASEEVLQRDPLDGAGSAAAMSDASIRKKSGGKKSAAFSDAARSRKKSILQGLNLSLEMFREVQHEHMRMIGQAVPLPPPRTQHAAVAGAVPSSGSTAPAHLEPHKAERSGSKQGPRSSHSAASQRSSSKASTQHHRPGGATKKPHLHAHERSTRSDVSRAAEMELSVSSAQSPTLPPGGGCATAASQSQTHPPSSGPGNEDNGRRDLGGHVHARRATHDQSQSDAGIVQLSADEELDEDEELLMMQALSVQRTMQEAQQIAEWFRQQLAAERSIQPVASQHAGGTSPMALPGTCFDKQAQTTIAMDPSNTGFIIYDLPDTEMELAIRQELEDIKMCQDAGWQAALGSIRACYNPPVGVGPGSCKRAAFLRLFLACRDRIQRQTELANLCEQMRRAELHRVLDGIRFLMESSLPDSDVELREAIFGRGFTDANLETKGEEFASVCRKWRRQLATVVNVLSERSDDVQLGVHLGRRVFVNTGGGTAASQVSALPGGAGGGLAARQMKNTDPATVHKQCFPGLVLEDDEGDAADAAHDAAKATFRSPGEEPEVDSEGLALQGKPALNSLETLAPIPTGSLVQGGGPYLVQPAIEMSPRGPECTAPFLIERGGMAAQPLSLDLLSADPEDAVFLAEILGATPDQLRVVAQRLPTRLIRPKRVLATRTPPALKESSSASNVHNPSSTHDSKLRPQSSHRTAGEFRHQARPSPVTSQAHEGSRSLPFLSSVSMSSTVAEPAAEVQGEVNGPAVQDLCSYTDMTQKQRLTPCWSTPGKLSSLGPDVEEPQAEPAPSRPQSGSGNRKSGTVASSYMPDRDREIERLRQTLCSGGLPRGPVPSADFYKGQEQKPGRPVGGRHTKQERWLLEKVPSTGRTFSAGRTRPVDPRGEAGPKPGSAPAGLFGTRSAMARTRRLET